MDISLFNRNLFLTREFETTKRLHFFQKELSLNLDLDVFDGSSRDKKVVSTFRPFLQLLATYLLLILIENHLQNNS